MGKSYNEIVTDEIPVLVDFYATWCGPCKTLAPILEEVKDSLGDKVKIIKIDVDNNEELASQQNVRGVPTMILYLKGKQVWRQSGVVDKQDIINVISQHCAEPQA